MIAWACLLGAAALTVPGSAQSQLISLKTVPVATGDQFLTLPSDRLGMGSVSIALDDRLLDPFVNPAKGALIEESTLFGSPTLYGVSNGNGGGKTLPFAALFRTENGFGGVSFALQQIDSGNRGGGQFFAPADAFWIGPQVTLNELSATNVYADGLFGFELGESGLSLGVGVSWAGLDALDGVEHLYSRAQRIVQAGHAVNYRLGVFSDREGRQFEATILHNRFSMTHDVSYLDWSWNDMDEIPTITSRLEINEDRTNTTGLHLGFARPITDSGWRVGGTWTVNHKSHPKIPNYEIVNIPRDPGTSWAYDFGVGIAKTAGPATFGIDLVFEPIWSDTWQEAEADTTLADGLRLREGEKTIENEFFFTNVKMRLGLAHETERLGFQLGVEVRSYDYALEQRNNLENTVRDQNESWMEWTPSMGARIKFPEFQLSYVGRMTTGSGRPGVAWGLETPLATDAAADFIVAPSGPLTLQDARVLTHQLVVSIPIR